MSSTLVVEILLGLIAAVIGFSSFYQATRANREQARLALAQSTATTKAVDAEAYERAREIYEHALNTLRAELRSTGTELHELRDSNEKLSTALREARTEISEVKNSNERLRGEITLLRAEIVRLTRADEQRESD